MMGEQAEASDPCQPLDFSWFIFMGIQMGYSENEIAHMYLSKWVAMFEQFKWFHNMKMNKGIFKMQKKVSLLDL